MLLCYVGILAPGILVEFLMELNYKNASRSGFVFIVTFCHRTIGRAEAGAYFKTHSILLITLNTNINYGKNQ